jgi:DNA-binding transcriptional LysR family regulator
MDRLGAMEMLVRVVETKSFSAAARDLNVGQPAVSKSIAQLEEQLGVRLLMRSTRGLTPTEAGHTFYERARKIIDAAHEAVLVVSGERGGIGGRLRVSAGVTLARLHIVPRLHAFLDLHPKLSLDLLLNDRVGDLIQEGVDMSFRTGVLSDSSVIARKVATARLLVVGTPGFFEQHGIPGTPADLARLPAVVYSAERAGGGDIYRLRRGDSELEIALSGRIRVSAAEAVRTAVLSGLGYAVASEWMFAPELVSGEVRAVLTDWLLPPLDCWALFPTGRLVTAKARAFADFVQAELGRTSLSSAPPPSRGDVRDADAGIAPRPATLALSVTSDA